MSDFFEWLFDYKRPLWIVFPTILFVIMAALLGLLGFVYMLAFYPKTLAIVVVILAGLWGRQVYKEYKGCGSSYNS